MNILSDDFFFWFAEALVGAFCLGRAVGNAHSYRGPLAQWQRYCGSGLVLIVGFVMASLRYFVAKMA